MTNMPKGPAKSKKTPSHLWESSTFERLDQLVRISSQSQNAKGVFEVQKIVAAQLEALGFQTTFFKGDRRDLAPLLVAQKAGEKKNKWISMICHADTVHEEEAMPSKLVRLSPHRAQGPGAIDNKGGIVTMLKGLESFLKTNPSHHLGLRVICSPSEEIGSPGLHHIFRHYSRTTTAVLGFEPANKGGDVIGSRQGNRWYNIHVEGQEAHAGRDHHKGLNAAYEMALKTVALQELTDYDKGITVNIGHIQAGQKKHNIVAKEARALIDVRFQSLKQRDEIHHKVLKIIQKNKSENYEGKSVQTKWKIVDDCPPFQQGPKSQKLFRMLQDLVKEQENKTLKCLHAGGCADSNHLNRAGMPVLDGLGPVGDGMHTDREWVDLKSLETRSKIFHQLLQKLMKDKEFHYVPAN